MEDFKDIGMGAGAGGIVSLIIFGIWRLCKHSRCKSTCCGREASVSVDLSPSGSNKDITLHPRPVLQGP